MPIKQPTPNGFDKVKIAVMDREFRQKWINRFQLTSVLVNLVMALGKFVIGLLSLSLSLCVNAMYNGGIGIAKGVALMDRNINQQEKNYGRVGLIISATSFCYIIYCWNMAKSGKKARQYQEIMAITTATFSFFEIGLAVYGIRAAKKLNSLPVEAMKRTNLVCALVSLVMTEEALLSLNGDLDVGFACGLTGMLMGFISVIIGLQMFFHARKLIKAHRSFTEQ